MFPRWFAAIKLVCELIKLAVQFPSLLRDIRRNQREKKKYERQCNERQKKE